MAVMIHPPCSGTSSGHGGVCSSVPPVAAGGGGSTRSPHGSVAHGPQVTQCCMSISSTGASLLVSSSVAKEIYNIATFKFIVLISYMYLVCVKIRV